MPDEQAGRASPGVTCRRAPRRTRLGVWLTVTVAVALLGVVAGCAQGGGGAGSGAPPSHASDGSPASVFSAKWELTGTVRLDPATSVAPFPAPGGAYVVWHNGTLSGSDGCNDFRASYHVTDAEVTISNLTYVPPIAPCPSANSWTQVLAAAAHWTTTNGDLVITDAQGGELTFSSANR